jgi:uncharacterized protein YwgA
MGSSIKDRIKSLCEFINSAGGSIEGRKKFQKLIYIAEETKQISTDYDFNWNLYGVYSYDLAADIEYSKLEGLIKEDKTPQFNYISHNYSSTDDALPSSEAQENQFLKSLNECDSSLLEVLSSIIFFYRSLGDAGELEKYLKLHKGHLSNYFEQGFAEFEKIKGKLN